MINASSSLSPSLPTIDFDNVIIKPVQKAICQSDCRGGGREAERGEDRH